MEIGFELSKIVTKLNARHDFVTEQLSACPDGKLSFERSGKGIILVNEMMEEGIRHRHKLSNETEIAGGLLRKCALQDEKDSLDHNIKLLNSAISRIKDYSVETEMIKLANRFPGIDKSYFHYIFDNAYSHGSSWSDEPYEMSDYKPEGKKHINSRGLKVRSKSEVLISEKLYEYESELSVRYEQVMHIGNITVIPDFTIRRKDGKIFIWEHEGLTNVKSYLEWQMKKAQLYANLGFVPWDNLITTYDNEDGMIDIRIVESEIRNKLII